MKLFIANICDVQEHTFDEHSYLVFANTVENARVLLQNDGVDTENKLPHYHFSIEAVEIDSERIAGVCYMGDIIVC